MSAALIDPWQAIGWVLLALLAAVYVGGVWQVWSAIPRRRLGLALRVLAAALALGWPLGLGSVVVAWMGDRG